MPHISEGLLHAHLDGALGPDEQLQWADAEGHLEVCDDCRRRLDEAAELREAARGLLAGATTSRYATRPAFDELVSRARIRQAQTTPGRRTGRSASAWWRKPTALGWAASLVIAAGAGWIGRQLVVEHGLDAPRVAAEQDATVDRPRSDDRARLEGFGDDATLEEARARPDVATTPSGPPPEEAEMQQKAESRMEAAPKGTAEAGAYAEDRAIADADAAARKNRMEEIVPLGVAVARASTAPRCYAAASDGGEAASTGRLEALRLAADGTAGLRSAERSMVGFWERVGTDTLRLRVTDGEGWQEITLVEADGGLRGDAELDIVGCP